MLITTGSFSVIGNENAIEKKEIIRFSEENIQSSYKKLIEENKIKFDISDSPPFPPINTTNSIVNIVTILVVIVFIFSILLSTFKYYY